MRKRVDDALNRTVVISFTPFGNPSIPWLHFLHRALSA